MTDQHPITPPPSLMRQWREQAPRFPEGDAGREERLIERAAEWGHEQRSKATEAELQHARDQELEACCELLKQKGVPAWSLLRLHRRPKPPSLKKQALEAAHIELDPEGRNGSLIIRALEALPDD